MAITKQKTNTQLINDLFKDLKNTPYEIGTAVLRERLVMIAEKTLKDIKEHPENWDNNPLISKGMYEDFSNRVIKIIGFNT